MNQVIATLPLSPRRNGNIGYYSIPLIADAISSFTGVPTLNAVNTLGTKRTTTHDVDRHFAMLERFGIKSQFQWLDGDEAWNTVLTHLFHAGFGKGWAYGDERAVMICPCGKTEFIATTSTLSEIHGTRKMYEIRNGKTFCLLCHGLVTSRIVPCLLVRLPNLAPSVTVIPAYASVEWNRLAMDVSGREILVSRIRETGIKAECPCGLYNIDVDFAWKLFLERLRAKNMQCLGLVVGHKTIKHALSMVLLGSLIGVPIPKFVVSTPYLSFDFGERSPIDVEELINLHGGVPLRWLLGMAIGCTRKELTLQSKLIYLIEHSIGVKSDVANNDSESIPVDVLWNSFNAERIQRILTCLRRGKPECLDSREYRLASFLGLVKRT